jgi:hypothetical protein
MTNYQRDALDWFSQNTIGATQFEGRWVWSEDIRRDADLANRFWQKIDRECRVTVS